jgi:hypothetical protein
VRALGLVVKRNSRVIGREVRSSAAAKPVEVDDLVRGDAVHPPRDRPRFPGERRQSTQDRDTDVVGDVVGVAVADPWGDTGPAVADQRRPDTGEQPVHRDHVTTLGRRDHVEREPGDGAHRHHVARHVSVTVGGWWNR